MCDGCVLRVVCCVCGRIFVVGVVDVMHRVVTCCLFYVIMSVLCVVCVYV